MLLNPQQMRKWARGSWVTLVLVLVLVIEKENEHEDEEVRLSPA
jgi:hypothetical protein